MIEVDIPGYGKLELAHLVLDYNGTLAVDGRLLPGVAETINQLAEQLTIHVLTADTFGSVRTELAGSCCTIGILPAKQQDLAKRVYVNNLGAKQCVAMGNGRNDRLMLQAVALGIALLQEEGTAVATLTAADVVCRNIHEALALLLNPRRLIATLRS